MVLNRPKVRLTLYPLWHLSKLVPWKRLQRPLQTRGDTSSASSWTWVSFLFSIQRWFAVHLFSTTCRSLQRQWPWRESLARSLWSTCLIEIYWQYTIAAGELCRQASCWQKQKTKITCMSQFSFSIMMIPRPWDITYLPQGFDSWKTVDDIYVDQVIYPKYKDISLYNQETTHHSDFFVNNFQELGRCLNIYHYILLIKTFYPTISAYKQV